MASQAAGYLCLGLMLLTLITAPVLADHRDVIVDGLSTLETLVTFPSAVAAEPEPPGGNATVEGASR